MRARSEAGFTLLETVVVTAIVALILAAAGTFFLAGATPAVAAADRDVVAAFDEGRRTALAFDSATVVFAPALTGSGYRARVYQRTPGDAAFQARNGPAFESTVAIVETAAPLGAPGFAFTIDSHGNVAALAGYTINGSDFVNRACPSSGAFALQLTYEHDSRTVTVPCLLGPSSTATLALETPPAAVVTTPAPAATCPAGATCAIASIGAAPAATCPSGLSADPVTAGLCDAPTAAPTSPAASSTCPPGFTGTPPNCSDADIPPTPSQSSPTPSATSSPGTTVVCQASAPDANGFAVCLSNKLVETGAAITRGSCGTHVPIVDPGAQFQTIEDVFFNNNFWGSYEISFDRSKAPWIDLQSGITDCGLLYTLSFHIVAITPIAGHAMTKPTQDTGDSLILNDGVSDIIIAPFGAAWGSNT